MSYFFCVGEMVLHTFTIYYVSALNLKRRSSMLLWAMMSSSYEDMLLVWRRGKKHNLYSKLRSENIFLMPCLDLNDD